MAKSKDLAGRQISYWNIIGYAGTYNCHKYWICRCHCGNISEVSGTTLLNERSKSCKLCADTRCNICQKNRKYILIKREIIEQILGEYIEGCTVIELSDKYDIPKTTIHGWAKKFGISSTKIKYDKNINLLFSEYKRRETRDGIKFSLDKDKFDELVKQNCNYCGKLANACKRECNGLDRINSNIGYIMANVVPCCSTCNWAKHIMTLEEFKQWIQQVAKHLNIIY